MFGERTYVEQVLRNLISNAGKYGTPGTTATVEAEETADEVLVRVLDRGTGVSAEEADRLFELFYRSPQATRTASGAGIGLYVSRGLITAMGGRIWTRPPRWRRVRVRVQPAPLPGGPLPGRERVGRRERGLTARHRSQSPSGSRGPVDAPGGLG